MVMSRVSSANARFALEGMLDMEGLTLDRGELDPGIYGEGYVDRRHPHTYLHELVATAAGSVGATKASIALGKGFVPFGTDDPMVRPFEKYPVNHHIAQIVERLLAVAAVYHAPFAFEAARFNGDEPESPSDWPNRSRLWDSWAARATLYPNHSSELQSSLARVKSPELPAGGGLDQRKVSISFRYDDSEMPATRKFTRYGLVEWGRSSDYEASRRAFTFTSFLAESKVAMPRIAFALRYERTERPEEERLADPFRTLRPATDFSISGRTRWDIISARVNAVSPISTWVRVAPFIEIAHARPTAVEANAVFDPHAFYGSDTIWGLSAGVSVTTGTIHRRVGRYGAASGPATQMPMGAM
jgi:hypothetical protein